MAKYMLIMRETPESRAATEDLAFDEMINTMDAYNNELSRAGVLLAAEGLDDPHNGVVVDFTGENPVVTDGPYGEIKELFNGYYIIDVSSVQEAVEWCKRMPLTAHTKIEIRGMPSIEDYLQNTEQVHQEPTVREQAGQP